MIWVSKQNKNTTVLKHLDGLAKHRRARDAEVVVGGPPPALDIGVLAQVPLHDPAAWPPPLPAALDLATGVGLAGSRLHEGRG